jgi:hypothetical protein
MLKTQPNDMKVALVEFLELKEGRDSLEEIYPKGEENEVWFDTTQELRDYYARLHVEGYNLEHVHMGLGQRDNHFAVIVILSKQDDI